MKASVLFHKVDLFKRIMTKPLPYSIYGEFEFQYNFTKLPNEHSLGSGDWLEAVFQSKYSKNLLFDSKIIGFNNLLFISKKHPDFFSMMYRDLVDTQRIISQRVDRFTFHLDEVWEDIRKTESKQLPKNHGIDLPLISLLLSVTDPTKYLHFNRDVFQNYLRVMESPVIQQFDDYERYCKVMRNTYLHMTKRIDMQSIIDLQLNPSVHYSHNSIAWAGIFARYVVGNLR